jgi:hypothetical protein
MVASATLELFGAFGVGRCEALSALHTDYANLEGVNTYPDHLCAGRTVACAGVGEYTFCLPDVLVDVFGNFRFTEVNTSNGGLTFTHHADAPRVEHQLDTLLARERPLIDGAVILVPRSPDTSLAPEIILRAQHFGAVLRERIGIEVHVRDASNALPATGVTVVTGTIPKIVPELASEGAGLAFRGRPVSFFNNQNLLAALARREGRDLEELLDALAPGLIHEGTAMAKIGMNKALQQTLAEGTGIKPVVVRSGTGLDETVELALEMAASYGGAVIKPDAASGGTCVVMVDARHTRAEVERMLLEGAEKMLAKYGDGWAQTCPMRVYEFVDARPAVHPVTGEAFRWDMRLEVLARPSETLVTPVLARTCPEPIGDLITPGNSMTNLTGRVRGQNERLSPAELFERIGLSDDRLDALAAAVHRWVVNALAV